MEKDFSRGHFEELLTERTGDYKMYPTEKVWGNIYHRLHTRRKWRFIGGGTFALMIIAGVFVLMQDNPHPPSTAYAIHNPSKSVKPAAVSAAPLVASLNSTSASRNGKSHSLSLTGNTYLTAGDYLLQSPAWLTHPGNAPMLSLMNVSPAPAEPHSAVGDDHTVSAPEGQVLTAPDKSSALAVGAPAPGSQETLSHMIGNEPLKRDAGGIEKSVALSSKPLSIIKAPTRYSWLFHFEPSVSFRVLKSRTAIVTRGVGVLIVDNNGYDINKLVEQRPSVGFEAGADAFYSLTDRLRLKAGLQFNYSRYTAVAEPTSTTVVNQTLGGSGGVPSTIYQTTSNYANKPSNTSIPNQRVELSAPIGAEYALVRTPGFSWVVSGTVQPTYILNSKAFLLTSDYHSYIQNPNLLRQWNINAAAETFLRFDRGPIQIQIGPQFRYQMMPSFISSYPISEHLYDVGFKIGIMRTIR